MLHHYNTVDGQLLLTDDQGSALNTVLGTKVIIYFYSTNYCLAYCSHLLTLVVALQACIQQLQQLIVHASKE